MILVLTAPATAGQIAQLRVGDPAEIRLAVDVELEVVAAGGEYHHDCEQVLLAEGSRQDHVWGATWIPASKTVRFDAFINIRPRLGNRRPEIHDAMLRTKIERIVRAYMEAV